MSAGVSGAGAGVGGGGGVGGVGKATHSGSLPTSGKVGDIDYKVEHESKDSGGGGTYTVTIGEQTYNVAIGENADLPKNDQITGLLVRMAIELAGKDKELGLSLGEHSYKIISTGAIYRSDDDKTPKGNITPGLIQNITSIFARTLSSSKAGASTSSGATVSLLHEEADTKARLSSGSVSNSKKTPPQRKSSTAAAAATVGTSSAATAAPARNKRRPPTRKPPIATAATAAAAAAGATATTSSAASSHRSGVGVPGDRTAEKERGEKSKDADSDSDASSESDTSSRRKGSVTDYHSSTEKPNKK
jgi:hypothetical protein